jgi:cobalt-zinc-cadmium efflux system protein
MVSATGSAVWDTVIALAIAVFVLVRAVMLGREVLAVLGQHAPAGIERRTEMLAGPGERGRASSGFTTCTCGP